MIKFIEERLENRLIQYLVLAGITALAAVLRFYKLGAWSFWYDEIFTLRDLSRIFEFSVANQQFSRWLIFGAVNLLGTNEFNARLVPALVGILSIPILYFPTRKMFNVPTALLFGIFLAVSPWHLYWSQNARFYTTLLLFYTLGLFLVYFALEEDRPWYLVFALLFFGLAVMEREFAALLVPIVAVYIIGIWLLPFEKPPGFRARNILILIIPTLLITIAGSYKIFSNPGKWLAGFGWINNNPIWILSGITFYIGIPFICIGSAAAVYYLLKKERSALLLAIAAILPALAIITLSMVQYSANRYVFVSLAPWLILSALGMWELFKQNKDRSWILVSGVLLTLLVFAMGENVLYFQYQNGNRDDWKGAFELLSNLKEPGDLVVVTEPRMGDYYLDADIIQDFGDLDYEALAESNQRYWFVEDNNLGEKEPEILDWVKKNSELIANNDVAVRARTFKMRIYLYDPSEP
jgi:mannosyltransferase